MITVTKTRNTLRIHQNNFIALLTFDAARKPRMVSKNDTVQEITTNKNRYMLIPVDIMVIRRSADQEKGKYP